MKFIGEVLEVHGPIHKENVTTKQLYKFLNDFKDLPYKGVFINLNTVYNVELEVAFRKAKFKRPIGQSSSNLTIIVNNDKFNPNNRWKRKIKIAQKENFSCKFKQSLSVDDCLIIESLHAENAKTKGLGYLLQAEEIMILTKQTNIMLFQSPM